MSIYVNNKEVKIPIDSELEAAVTRAKDYLNKVAELDLNFVDTVYYLLCIGASEEVYKIYGSLYEKDSD